MKKRTDEKKKMKKGIRGITLIALVVTIVVLLILAGVSINLIIGQNGMITKAGDAKNSTVIGQEKEQVKMAYASASLKKLGASVTDQELQEELNASVGEGKTLVTYNADKTLNVLFNETSHNYNVQDGEAKKVEVSKATMAVFDIGTNVTQKMYALAEGGKIKFWYITNNLSIDAIKKYNGTPDLSSMTDANIVSCSDLYTEYEENPDEFSDIIKEGTKLCPIYMWFEESGTEEIRSIWGDTDLTEITNSEAEKNVKTGTIYWWCESDNVYLHPDSRGLFLGLSYLSDISGLQSLRSDYVEDMSGFLSVISSNKKLKNFDALSDWNVGNVKTLGSALCGYENLDNINGLRYWDTSNVISMNGMFGDLDMGITRITDLSPLANWDVSNVTDMSCLFLGSDITDLSPLANWDVSNVTNMSQMFDGCDNLTDASGINNWEITNVSNFESMFIGCSTHPDFTKVEGTWDDYGTFTPNN